MTGRRTVLVCGGRDYIDRQALFAALDAAMAAWRFDRLVHGGARGADALAGLWAASHGVDAQVYRADWSQGRSAGPTRNVIMYRTEQPGAVIAFPGGRGTAHMVSYARACRCPVVWQPYGR